MSQIYWKTKNKDKNIVQVLRNLKLEQSICRYNKQ